VALAVDLYAGRVTAEEGEALALSNELSTLDAMKVVQGARDLLAGHPRCNGKVGVTGFCLGGAMALAAACNVEGLGAALPFYGLPRVEHADWSRARIPIQGHYAKEDAFVTPERVRAAHAAALTAGVTFDLHFYDAGHAFMRQGDPHAYHSESAALAWSRATQFLHQHLG
jgi:carboxymethylenebutenolidase